MFKKAPPIDECLVLLIAVLPLFFTSCGSETADQEPMSVATIVENARPPHVPAQSPANEPVADLLVEMSETEKDLWGDLATLKSTIRASEQRLEEKEQSLMRREAELEAGMAVLHSREASFRQTELVAYGMFAVSVVLIIAIVVSEIRGKLRKGQSDDTSNSKRRSTEGEKKTKGAETGTARKSPSKNP